jgi:hypothetical protein
MNNLNKILLEIDEKEFDFKIGDLKSFLDNEPQKYFNHDVVIETYQSLNIICENDFINNFEEIKSYFFSFIYSYYHIVDIYNELDDISFDSEIKIKIYYLPIITQIIENVFSNFYRVVNYHLGTDKTAMMLNPLKKSLNNIFDSSFNEIDIDFRNAISHGKVSINGNIMFYTYSDKSVKPWRDKTEQINLNQIENLTNKLIDTSSAVFLAFMFYLNKIELFDKLIMKNKDDSYTNNELLKLYLKSEKAEIKYINTIEKPLNNQLLLEKNILNHYDSIFEVFIHFKNIQTKDDIQQVATNTILFLNKYYENYDKYIVNYSYDYSPNGIIVYDEVLDNIFPMIWDIERLKISPKSYKYHNFKEIKNEDWEVKNIADFSVENIKRIRGKLFIKKENISNDKLKEIFHKATKEVRQLQILQNPKDTRAKYLGEADIVYLNVFYDNLNRINYGYEELSDNFICNLIYYRTKTTLVPDYPFQNIHLKEEIPKHIIWWKNDEVNH